MENKLVIFDLDGVLIESKMMHFHTLNLALEKVGQQFVIGLDEHLKEYDGLPTIKKLEKLTKTKNLPETAYKQIREEKQLATSKWVNNLEKDIQLIKLFCKIKNKNKIAVASNSIRDTVKNSLTSLGLIDLVDYYISNQDVTEPKPSPEMFEKCMTVLGFTAKDTVIIEDSDVGIKAATATGAEVIVVKGPEDLKRKL